MPSEDRAALGVRTQSEVTEASAVRLERKLQGQIVSWLRLRGIEVGWGRTDVKSGYTTSWPDLTFAVDGVPVAWEVKLPGRHPTPAQAAMHEKMRSNGWRVAVVRSLDEAKASLDAAGG